MPVPGGRLEPEMMIGLEVALDRPEEADGQEAGPDDDMEAVETGRHVEGRGIDAVPETERIVDLGVGAIESVTLGIIKTSTKIKGIVYADLDEDGEFDEDIDLLLQGLLVILDEVHNTLTDDAGRFFFLSVPFGEHILWIGENIERDENSGEDAILSLSIPITLDRSVRAEFTLLWPWTPTGPDQGFLQIDVEKSEDN